MNFKTQAIGLWAVASLACGWMTQPLADVARRSPAGQATLGGGQSLASLESGLGQGITLAALGGYRTVAANFVWISMYGDWQYRRVEPVLEKMRLAVSLNPDSVYFWVDGSRIIANDLPVWELGDERMHELFETPAGLELRQLYGERALDFLDQAPEAMQDEVEILVERGAISWRRIGDLDRAIRFFAQAVEQEDAPYYVSRVYAELLYRAGQVEAAYEYLKRHYATLPEDELSAMKPVVRQRLQQLEAELASTGDAPAGTL